MACTLALHLGLALVQSLNAMVVRLNLLLKVVQVGLGLAHSLVQRVRLLRVLGAAILHVIELSACLGPEWMTDGAHKEMR